MRGRAIPSRERMAEMGRLGRFFVNRFKGRANERLFCWIRQNLVLREGSGCLELGAGKGDMALRTDEAYRPARYVATDYDPEQVKAARRFLAAAHPDRLSPALELQAADALRLDFPDGTFDAVFAFAMLHHVGASRRDFEPIARALGQFDRVLRPGGKFVYQEFAHKAEIRDWLISHGYRIEAERRGVLHDEAVARKTS